MVYKRRLKVGRRFQVMLGAGIDSEREGVMVNPNKYMKQIEAEEGRYHPFNERGDEVALLDKDGKIFTMFYTYLLEIDDATGKVVSPWKSS